MSWQCHDFLFHQVFQGPLCIESARSEYAAACPGPGALLTRVREIRGGLVDGWAAPCRCVASITPWWIFRVSQKLSVRKSAFCRSVLSVRFASGTRKFRKCYWYLRQSDPEIGPNICPPRPGDHAMLDRPMSKLKKHGVRHLSPRVYSSSVS